MISLVVFRFPAIPPAKAKTVSELVAYIKIIADTTPDIPVYYYHIPIRTGINFNMIDLLLEAKDKIPNLVGIKYANSNFMDMQKCLNFENGQFDILHGSDETLLCGLSIGIKGGIGTTYNLIPEVYYGIIDAYNNNDTERAKQLQLKSVNLLSIISKYGGGIVGGKHLMKMAQIDCGPCRIPLRTIDPTEAMAMEKELKNSNLYEMITNTFTSPSL